MWTEVTLVVPDDAHAVRWHALFDDREVMRYIGDGSIRDQRWYEQFVAKQQQLANDRGVCLYSVLAEGRVVGFAGLQPWSHTWGPTGAMELGWRLARESWGNGYATCAARQALAIAASAGIERVTSLIHSDNTRSSATAERLGMHHERDWTGPDGQAVRQYGRSTLTSWRHR